MQHAPKATVEFFQIRNREQVMLWSVRAVLVCSLSMMLAVGGPFGTFEIGSLMHQFGYWFVLISLSLILVFTLKPLISRLLATESLFLREAALILSMMIVFTPVLRMWSEFMSPGSVAQMGPVWRQMLDVGVICVAICLIKLAVPIVLQGRAIEERSLPRPRLMDRMEDTENLEILRLSVSGHKVQVVTNKGTTFLRMRFADAVLEMTDVVGYCSHRSHWVAAQAISGHEIQNGRPVLILTNGDLVPVSRKYQPDLEAAGLL